MLCSRRSTGSKRTRRSRTTLVRHPAYRSAPSTYRCVMPLASASSPQPARPRTIVVGRCRFRRARRTLRRGGDRSVEARMDCHLLRAGDQSRAGRLVRVDRHRVDPHQKCRRRRAVLLDAPTSDAALCSRGRLLLAIHADRRPIAGCLWTALGAPRAVVHLSASACSSRASHLHTWRRRTPFRCAWSWASACS